MIAKDLKTVHKNTTTDENNTSDEIGKLLFTCRNILFGGKLFFFSNYENTFEDT